MKNKFNTILECETSDTILNLIDPKKLIIKTNSVFRYSEHNELVFESQGETMHKDIILLSEKLWEEVFTAICYDHEINEKTEMRYIRYEAGIAELLGHMPIYSWENYVQTIEASGKEEFELLWRRIRKYLFWYDQTQGNILDGVLAVNIPENNNGQCVRIEAIIFAELDNFRISVGKTRKSDLYFNGYQRNSEFEDWEKVFESRDNGVPF